MLSGLHMEVTLKKAVPHLFAVLNRIRSHAGLDKQFKIQVLSKPCRAAAFLFVGKTSVLLSSGHSSLSSSWVLPGCGESQV